MKTCTACRGSGALYRPRRVKTGSKTIPCYGCQGSGTRPSPVNWRAEKEKRREQND